MEFDPDQEIQFYCRNCDEFCFAPRDSNGMEQTLCPNCGEWCFTPEFEAREMQRSQSESAFGLWLIWHLIFALAASGVGWAILRNL